MSQINIGNSTTELMWVSHFGQGKLKYQGKEGDKRDYFYHANILVDASQRDDIMEKIKEFYNENAENVDKFPYDPTSALCYCPYRAVDGMFEFRTKTRVWYGKTGEELVQKRIDVYDAKNRIKSGFDKIIGNGSIGVVSARMITYNMLINGKKVAEPREGDRDKYGVTLMLDKIQLIKLKEMAAASPFEATEGEKPAGKVEV